MKKLILALWLCFAAVSCVSTKSTIRNIDNSVPEPKLVANTFVVTELATDSKYGFDPDYPVNVYYRNAKDENANAERYLRALAGPKGQKISFSKVETCCPFASKNIEIGAGFLDIYEISWPGNDKQLRLYINIYEKGKLLIPVGLSAKK